MVTLEHSTPLAPYITRELREHYAATSDETRELGRLWYKTARRSMLRLSRRTGYTLRQAVAAMAITSPGAQLVSNVEWTRTLLESRPVTGGYHPVGRFPNVMGSKLRPILDDATEADRFVTGPKVGPFFRAILGDRDALVIDRWALRAATGSNDLNILTDGLRKAVEAAYRDLAAEYGEDVRDFQAIVWIHVRTTTPDAKGRLIKLADVFEL